MRSKRNIRFKKKIIKKKESRKDFSTWTNTEFLRSFKSVRLNYFHFKITKPKTEMEKVLFVSANDLNIALKNIKTSGYSSKEKLIHLDETEINNAYEQIIK